MKEREKNLREVELVGKILKLREMLEMLECVDNSGLDIIMKLGVIVRIIKN